MLGEKERFYILGQQNSGKFMLWILGTSVKYKENPKLSCEYKETQLVGLRWDKGRFTLLHFANTTISFTSSCLLHFSTLL